jgi:hypothetical protein
VAKHISPERDWVMRATADQGREASLWEKGVLDRVAHVIDYPVVAVAPEPHGWVIVMRTLRTYFRKASG